MNKVVLALIFILALLVSTLPGTLNVTLVKANPYGAYTYTAPPIISIYAPTQNGTSPSNVLLNFTITKSDGWLIWSNSSKGNFRNQLYSVDIMIDGQFYRQIVANSYLSSPFIDAEYLDNLTSGNHTLALKTYCEGWDLESHGFWNNRLPYQTYSDLINFTVDTTLPEISAVSPLNATYYSSVIPLNFIVNEEPSLISYSLDGQNNLTLSGNTTLTNLPVGEHKLIVYCRDVAGNVGVSEIKFTIEPFPTALVATASAAIVGLGLLVYFKKRKQCLVKKCEQESLN